MNTITNQARAFAGQYAAETRDAHHANHRLRISADRGNGLCSDRGHAIISKIVLVPLTLSSGARTALAVAENLAREAGAKLVLLHVVQLNIAGEERGIQRTRLLEELCRNAESELQQLAECLGSDVTAEILVCQGRPAEAIVDAAKRLGAGAVVMYKHRYHNWLRWLHRNTARTVMRQAPCKICLIFQEKHHDAVNLIVADHAAGDQLSGRIASHENQRPSRSFF
jgi:nucleotide-binding universal stress UspA family protein